MTRLLRRIQYLFRRDRMEADLAEEMEFHRSMLAQDLPDQRAASRAWGNATLADLLTALEETSSRDLASWSAQWLQTAGVNTLRPSYSVGEDDRFTEFAVEQEAPATHPVLRSHRIAIGLYDKTEAGLSRRLRVETDMAGPRTVIPEIAGQRRPDRRPDLRRPRPRGRLDPNRDRPRGPGTVLPDDPAGGLGLARALRGVPPHPHPCRMR